MRTVYYFRVGLAVDNIGFGEYNILYYTLWCIVLYRYGGVHLLRLQFTCNCRYGWMRTVYS